MIKILLFVVLIFICQAGNAQLQTGSPKENKSTWYSNYECMTGLSIVPDFSTNRKEFEKQYRSHKKWWDEAFQYIKNTNLASLTPGSYPIDGEDVYVKVTEAVS